MRYVLFVCTQNAGRSQMAEAFFRRLAPEDLRAESAGQEPADQVQPVVVEAMKEVGVDLSNRRPKKLSVEMQLHADWGITLACGAGCPYVASVVEDWDVADPAGKTIEKVRLIRDEIERRVRELLSNRIQEIRFDKTAHMARLARLLPPLVEEFGDVRDPNEIRTCADAILEDYDDVPVRSFALTLAHRRARECLRAEVCAVLASRGG